MDTPMCLSSQYNSCNIDNLISEFSQYKLSNIYNLITETFLAAEL